MASKLPHRPDLDHLRRQAKELLAAFRRGDAAAAREFKTHLPEAAKLSIAAIQTRDLRLADAQSAIARRSGFGSWPGLARHVSELRALEGAWEFASLEVEGSALPKGALAGSRIVMDGDLFRSEMPGVTYEGVFVIDVESRPHHIDIVFERGPEAGRTSLGLYELSGDRLTICLGLAGRTRPEGFVTTPGSGHALETLVRRIARPAEPPTASDFVASPMEELEDIAGEWSAVDIVLNGQSLPTMMLKVATRTLKGGRTCVSVGGRAVLEGETRLDRTTSPWSVDYRLATGAIQRAIMRQADGMLETCLAAPGEPRPDRFDGGQGSGWTLSRWRRKG